MIARSVWRRGVQARRKFGSRSFKKFGPVNERVDQRVRTFSFRARQPAFVVVRDARKWAGIQENSNFRRSKNSIDDDSTKNAPLRELSRDPAETFGKETENDSNALALGQSVK
jgi:hypothetical protein